MYLAARTFYKYVRLVPLIPTQLFVLIFSRYTDLETAPFFFIYITFINF